MNELEQKKLYAKKIVEAKGDAFKAAINILGKDRIGAALRLFNEWSDDIEVIEEINRIKNSNPDSATANKLDILQKCWEWIDSKSNNIKMKDRIEAMKLYCEIKGLTGNDTNVSVSVPSVMLVKQYDDSSSWEKIANKQQNDLISGEKWQ